MTSKIECNVEELLQNPHCAGIIVLFCLKKDVILLRMSLSKSLDNVDNKEIGRYLSSWLKESIL